MDAIKRLALLGLALALAACATTESSRQGADDSAAPAQNRQQDREDDSRDGTAAPTVTTQGSAAGDDEERENLIEAINRDGEQPSSNVGVYREEPPEPVEAPDSDVVELNYEQVELREILSDLAGELDISLVIDPSISAQVSIRTADDRPLGYDDIWPLVRLLTREAGVRLEREGNVYYARQEDDGNLPMEISTPETTGDGTASRIMQITPLTYISAGSGEEMLEPLVQPDGRITRIGNTNTLAITANESQLSRLNELLRLVDADPFRNQGIRLYDLDVAPAGEVATELQDVLSMIEGDSPAYQVQALERINAVLVTAPANRGFSEIDRWVDLLDAGNQDQTEQLFQYRVKNLNATDLASTLSEVFGSDEQEDEGESDSRELGEAQQRLREQQQPGQDQVSQDEQDQDADGQDDSGGDSAPPSSGVQTGEDTMVTEVVSADLEVTIVADDATNTLLIRANPRDYRQLLATINQLDAVPLQVMINAAIAQITLTDDTAFGVDWSSVAENLGSGSSEISTGFMPQPGEDERSGLGGLLFNRSFLDGAARIDATLEAIATNNEVRLLARPSLTVVNNMEGLIRIGSEVPVQLGETVTAGGNRTSNIQFRPTGIELTITPRINDDGVVNLSIRQELSSVSENSGVDDNPVFDNQEIETSVVVRDNENVVLGGLIQDNNDTLNTGVPVLSEIPGLGRLFSFQRDNNERRELFIVLRPEIINLNDRSGDRYQEVVDRFETAAQMIQDSDF